jgi:hypothetical protein
MTNRELSLKVAPELPDTGSLYGSKGISGPTTVEPDTSIPITRKWIIIERILFAFRMLFFAACLIVFADQAIELHAQLKQLCQIYNRDFIFQTRICVDKLLNPPIDSKVSIRVNESIWYPSMTICSDWDNRFKASYVKSLGMDTNLAKPETWKNFPWDNLTLDEFWRQATWGPEETIVDFTFGKKWAGRWDNFATLQSK